MDLSVAGQLVSGSALLASEIVRVDTKSPKDGRTFRVCGVPLDWDAGSLRTFLAVHENPADAIVKSLAHEIHGRSKTATVTFENIPF